mmetsp:Transcript_9925/g.9820  ORF Transcript_9925/g.9820 Transcript_9925/m.9820 type:complete len:93 (+) Transcript_9925:2587-2865(+)
MLDIRKQTYATIIWNLVRNNLSLGNLALVIKILQQLRQFLLDNASQYPLDYYSEFMQFKSNYPYREFKFTKFIRSINYNTDVFPFYLGNLDS